MAGAGRSTGVAALGPLEARVDDAAALLGGAKQRTVLARLVVAHPAAVDHDALVDAVWGDEPPAAAASALAAYLSRLRKVLGPESVVRGPAGHRLSVDVQHADWLRFREALDLGRRAVDGRRFAEAASILAPALATWRGARALAPFSDTAWARPWVSALGEDRQRGICLLAESQLVLGGFDEALAVLQGVDPASYDETPVLIAVRAHHAAGRSAAALETYEHHRRRLADDLGLDPSDALHRLQLDVLRHGPGATWTPPTPPEAPRSLPPRPRRLAGRDGAVRRVAGLLADERCVVLTGLAGVGKTSIAADVAHAFPGPVWWVSAGDETSALATLTELAFRLGLPRGLERRELLTTVWGRLDAGPDWLVVLDDAPSPDEARWLLPASWSHGQVLVTSLDPTWNREGVCLHVAPLGRDDAVSFVLRRTGRLSVDEPVAAAGSDGVADAGRLVDELGGLPLALEQACTYMSQTGMGPDAYLRLFRIRRDQLLTRGAPASHPHPAATTWQLLFDTVRDRAPMAAELLEVASFLSCEGVGWSLLDDGGQESSEAQLARLDAVLELVRCSLVDRDDAELRVHRLVQDVVRSRLRPAERTARADAAARALARATPAEPDRPETWETWSGLLGHLEALLRAAADVRVVPAGLVPLVERYVAYLRYRSGLLLAENLVTTALDLLGGTHADPRSVALLHALRSEVRDDLGRLPDARTDIMTALALAGPVASRRPDLETARTWARLAHVLSCADERSAAVDLYLRSVDVLGVEGDLADLVGALLGLAYTYWGRDEHAAAEGRCREAVDLLESAGQTGHPLYPAALSALGMMLHEQGRWVEARDLQLAALDLLGRLHGDREHHDAAYVHDKLGYVEGLLGHHEESLVEHQRAADILTRLFGERDPRRAIAISNRGLAERALDQHDRALRSQQEAFTLLDVAFGGEHKLTRLVAERLALARGPVVVLAQA